MAIPKRQYTQQEIDDLIACPKVISEAPKREMKLDRGLFRNDMRLKSTDEKMEFRVFMWRSEDLPENFSIGLAFLAKDGSGEVVLLRCNGPHGGYNGSFDPGHPHYDYHVHRASVEMIEAGMRPESAAAISNDFASYEGALLYFLRATNVTDARTYFADHAQGILHFPDKEPAK